MGMSGPGLPATTAPKKRPTWMVGGATIVSFVALLYIIEVWDNVTGHRLDQNGIRLRPITPGTSSRRVA
jgi:hypothetical protein